MKTTRPKNATSSLNNKHLLWQFLLDE